MGKEESVALEHCQELMETVETIEDKLHQLEVIKIEFRQEIQNKINYRSALLSFSFLYYKRFFLYTRSGSTGSFRFRNLFNHVYVELFLMGSGDFSQ